MKISKKDKSFLSGLIWLTLAVSAASLGLVRFATMWWPLMVVFFFLVSVVMYRCCEKARQKDMRRFYNFYMVSTVVKLVVYLSILTIYSLNFKEDSKRFMLTFLAYYVIYSVFETWQLVRKKENKNE